MPKIQFLELDNNFGHSMQGIHFPEQSFCPIEKILIFREMGTKKLTLAKKDVASFEITVKHRYS